MLRASAFTMVFPIDTVLDIILRFVFHFLFGPQLVDRFLLLWLD